MENILSKLYKNKYNFFKEYYELTDEDMEFMYYDPICFLSWFKRNKKNKNDNLLEEMNKQLDNYNMSVIITDRKRKRTLTCIDVCFEKKQSKERKSNNYYVRFFYDKDWNVIRYYNEKNTSVIEDRHKYKTTKIFGEDLYATNEIWDLLEKNVIDGELNLDKVLKKREYKNANIYSNGRFALSKTQYSQKHYIVKNKEIAKLFKSLVIDLVKDAVSLFEIYTESMDMGAWWYDNNIFGNDNLELPIYELKYLKIKGKDEVTVKEAKRNEKEIKNNKDIIKEDTVYIPEAGKINKKRNEHYKFIKDNGLIRGIEWL